MGIHSMAIWIVLAGTIILVLAFIECGYRLGCVRRRRIADEKESQVGAIAGAILGLASFMLAFTFGIVTDRYDAKRALVREEAIAIRTAWLRSDFLPDPDRAEAADLLRRHVDVRVDFARQGNMEPRRLEAALSETQRLQEKLWGMAVAHARTDMNSDVAALYVDSLNQVIALHVARVSIGIQARLPGHLWVVLACITALGMASLGYQTGLAGSRRSQTWPILAISFALVFTLIAALDRPATGVIRISQEPLIDLQGAMGDASAIP
jgi:hypothetical protein